MEPPQKRVKVITDHFRILARQSNNNKQQQQPPPQHQQQATTTTRHDDAADLKGNNRRLGVVKKDNNNNENQLVSSLIESKSTNALVSNTTTALKAPTKPARLNHLRPVINKYQAPPSLARHPNVVDYDSKVLDNVYFEPHYAQDSFNYDREQELKFRNKDYLVLQPKLTPQIRAKLVDRLVQIQDFYSLEHETLYLAVKICDQYLMRKAIEKNQLELLYMTAIFIAAKFDERLPPLEISNLLQHARQYTRKQVLDIEIDILRTISFNVFGYPLSYVFLRRFANCMDCDRKTSILARYILESSLLDYELIEVLESELAAASLLLAFKMLHQDDAWNETAVYYTRYEEKDLTQTLTKLNQLLWRATNSSKATNIRIKYSHQVFQSVSKIAPLPDNLLVNNNGDDVNKGSRRFFGKRIINN